MADPTRPDPIHPLLERAKNQAINRASIYGVNSLGEKTAYILPDGDKNSFTPDPEGVNINGGKTARYVFQVRLTSDPTIFGNSRVGSWNSVIWEPLTGTPTAKASHYANYWMATGDVGDASFPQEVGVGVFKGVTPAAQQHGKLETLITVAEQEAGANGKMVIHQLVGDFKGADIGWNADDDDDSGAGGLDDTTDSASPASLYPAWGWKCNAAATSTIMLAAGGVSAASGSGGWHHGHLIKADSVHSFSYRHKGQFGVQVTGFDPGDGTGARVMPYMGIGTDLPDMALHVKGPMAVETRLENSSAVSPASPYIVGRVSYFGRSDLGVTPLRYGAVACNAIDVTHSAEAGQLRFKTVYNGSTGDRMYIGQGVFSPTATGGDKGAGSINFSAVYIDGVLALGVDTSAPATPAQPGVPTQTLRTSAAGTQQIVVDWTWTANTEPDLKGYSAALKRDSGGFSTVKVKDNTFQCVANAGEVLQLKISAHDTQGNDSVYSTVRSYTVTGDAAAPAIVTASVAPVARPKGVMMKITGPSDTNYGGAVFYVNTVNNSATATALDFVPGRPSKKIKYRDDDAHTAGDTLYYWAASVNLDGVESATRTSLGSPVTYALIADADLDQSVPATPASGPTLSQSATLGSDGVLQSRLQASIPTPSDATRVLFALQRAGGNFDTIVVDATTTTTTASWVVGPGEACVVKFKSINALGRKSSAYSPTTSLTISGDSTAPGVVSAISVTPAPKGMVVKATAPSDKDFVGAQVYRHTSNVPASATALEIAPGRPGRKIRYIDNDALTSGQDYYYFMASVDASDNEGSTRTVIGHATYIGVQGSDLETGAVDLAGTKVTGKSLANVDSTANTKLGGIATGATKNIVTRATSAPGTPTTGDIWINTTSAPHVLNTWDGSAWQASARNTTLTTHLSDAKGLSRLDPSDLVDYPGLNVTGGAGQSSTLTYGSNKPSLAIKNTSAGAYTLTLAGGSDGDAMYVANSASSTKNVTVIGDASYTLIPGQEGVFVYQAALSGFNLRLQRVLSDTTSNLIPGPMIPYGTAANTAAQGNDSRITGAAQTASSNTFSGARNSFTGLFNIGPEDNITISSGAITATSSNIRLETEGGAATDDLTAINGGQTGDIVLLWTNNSAHDVTVQNGTGNIRLPADRLLSNINDRLLLMYNGSTWCELCFADNG